MIVRRYPVSVRELSQKNWEWLDIEESIDYVCRGAGQQICVGSYHQGRGEWVLSNDSNVGVPTRMVEEQRKFLLHAELCESHHN